MYKISVIAIFYNVELYAEQCIQSIINQSYRNLEIILVDDGSCDSCGDICDKYAKLDSRIKVIHKVNGGADSARKAGIMVATGKYVGFVDGDDWIEPGMYESLMELAVTYGATVIESGLIDTAGDYSFIRKTKLQEGIYTGAKFDEKIEPYILYGGTFFEYGITVSLCNKIYERELIKKYLLLPELSKNLTDDVMCSLPCIIEAKSIYITHEAFYHYRVRDNSYKHTVRGDVLEVVRKYYPDWIMRFSCAKNMTCIEKQLQYFILYLLLMKAIYVFEESKSEKILIPFGGIEKNKKIILYGAGATGIYIYDYLVNIQKQNVIWVDKNYKNLQKSLPVLSPDIMKHSDYDYVVLSVLWASKVCAIKEDLAVLGVPGNKIRWISDTYISEPQLLLNNLNLTS